MEHTKKNKRNLSINFTEFIMKKEEAPYDMGLVINKNPNYQPL